MTTIPQLIARSRDLLRDNSCSEAVLQELAALMDGMTPDDVPVPGKTPERTRSAWQQQDLCTTAHFSLALFTVAQGEVIPLHDHPSMWVLMRALAGDLQLVAYDWVRRDPAGGLARRSYHVPLTAESATVVVAPERGNIHQVLAGSDCAFLDLTFPPYSDEQQRGCRFYRIAGEQSIDGEALTRLATMNGTPP